MLNLVRRPSDVSPRYRDTPIGDLFAYHNWGEPHGRYSRAQILVGMCMDSRLRLRTPDGFAFIMRVAGSNFRGLEFQTSFAIAIGGVRAIALIGHDQCAMTSLRSRRSEFIDGLIEGADWSREEAESHFDALSPGFEISDPAEFVRSQAQCLRQLYSGVVVAPLMYDVGDGLLYQLDENEKTDQ